MNDFKHQCKMLQDCLPDAGYRKELSKLHDAMLEDNEKLKAFANDVLKCCLAINYGQGVKHGLLDENHDKTEVLK